MAKVARLVADVRVSVIGIRAGAGGGYPVVSQFEILLELPNQSLMQAKAKMPIKRPGRVSSL
jgi:hypothetical protein